MLGGLQALKSAVSAHSVVLRKILEAPQWPTWREGVTVEARQKNVSQHASCRLVTKNSSELTFGLHGVCVCRACIQVSHICFCLVQDNLCSFCSAVVKWRQPFCLESHERAVPTQQDGRRRDLPQCSKVWLRLLAVNLRPSGASPVFFSSSCCASLCQTRLRVRRMP